MGTITIALGNESGSSSSPVYRYWKENGQEWREGIRDSNFVRDKTLTDLGWDGVEGPGDGTGDWENTLEDE